MKQKIIAFLLILCTAPAFAEYKTKAKSAFLIDYDSGAEIVSIAADELMPPSSMLKLMTLTVLFDEIKAGMTVSRLVKMRTIKIHFGIRQARFAFPRARIYLCVI